MSGAGPGIIKLAIMAVGGQGGAVLTNWIVSLAQARNWHVQSTAVAGVAQRTGATIYYVEMAAPGPRRPVFALAPAAGDLDILIAAEWAEAGRAVQRGFVTPDRTVLIASTHRMLAVSEKIVPGDGHGDDTAIAGALDQAAARVIAFDMQSIATDHGSVISAALFGALAGSGALPFATEDFEAAIRRGDRGVAASLAAFRGGFNGPPEEKAPPEPSAPVIASTAPNALELRAKAYSGDARIMAQAGLDKVIDFQDAAYGEEYLDRLDAIHALDSTEDQRLTAAAAKHIANAMTYDDVIRVADLKTRGTRSRRITGEMQAGDKPLHITEFLHPRGEEIIGLFPARLGRWVEARPSLAAWIDRRVNRGRRIRSDRIGGFLSLYLFAGVRRWRRGTRRHALEQARLDEWLNLVHATVPRDYDLAVEVLNCRRLIKGYSDTHARGQTKFDKVLSALPLLEGRADAADWLRRLREAALQDEAGDALDGALRTIASFAAPPHEPEGAKEIHA